MARLAKYTESILVNTTGTTVVPAYGATVTVYYPDTTTPITSIYSDSAGTVAISGAQITLGVDGLLEFYVRSQDRTFDLYIEESADTSKPQFTAFTVADVSATYDDSVFYASEYSSLQAAVDATTAGSKLIVDEDFTLSAALSIAKSDIVIEGFNRGIRLRAGTNLNANLVQLEGDRITLRNMEIDGNASNQSGGGPYYGISFSGYSNDCLIEDLYIHTVKGDGVLLDDCNGSTFRRIISTANYGYGFSYAASGTDSTYITLDDCHASANGTNIGSFTRRDGFNFTPPIANLTMVNCKALSNYYHGIHLVGDATSATISRIKIIGCTSDSNGAAGASYSGLKIVSNSNSGTIINEVEITGGHYSDNSLYGIHMEASETATNPGTASVIRNVQMNGVTCSSNAGSGMYLQGRISYVQIANPLLYNNCQSINGSGIVLVGATLTNALADFGDEGRCRWVVITSPIVSAVSGAATHEYAINLGLGTKGCIVNDIVAHGMETSPYFWIDSGKGNVVRTVHLGPTAGDGIGGGGGFPAMALHTDTSYGAGLGKFWLTGRTKTVSASETRVGSPRVSSKTRVVSLTPLDISAAATFWNATSAGWYQDLAGTVSGSATAASGGATANMGYVTIKTVGGQTNYGSGEFLLLCFDSITGI